MSLRRRWLADLGATLTRPARTWLARRAAIRNREFPEGCCECGTGGPYYRGRKTPVVRYLYSGACAGTPAGEVDWASCSRHPLDMAPLVDYGSDVQVTAAQADADALRAAIATAGLTVGYLRALLQDLPADTPVRVEDPSRPGPIPGSTAEHTVTGAATGMPLHDGTDGVLLLIDPKPEPDGAQPTAEDFRAALLDHLQRAELQTLGLGPYDGAVLDLVRDLVGNFEIPEED